LDLGPIVKLTLVLFHTALGIRGFWAVTTFLERALRARNNGYCAPETTPTNTGDAGRFWGFFQRDDCLHVVQGFLLLAGAIVAVIGLFYLV
jgi:hypothetical protein